MSRYQGEPRYPHDSPERMGVLLCNLGTPDAPTPKALRNYLKQFLSDPRVVEAPRWIWWFVLNVFILNTRPKRSAALYRKVWTDEGSPLLTISRRQEAALQKALDATFTGPVQVALAMNYGSPSIPDGLRRLREAGCRRILVLPLYPQYSAATTASVFDAVTRELQTWRWQPELRFIHQYHDHPGYIGALAARIREHWQAFGEPERLLFSFHGIPKQYLLDGDPYHCHCRKTARLTAERLDLDADRWAVGFQSRVGPKEWLKPYTDHLLADWGKKGPANVHVVCPGFAADCLETLDEIAREARDTFLEAGGEAFRYIDALNDDAEHIRALTDLVRLHTQGWPETDPGWNEEVDVDRREGRKERARALGAKQ